MTAVTKTPVLTRSHWRAQAVSYVYGYTLGNGVNNRTDGRVALRNTITGGTLVATAYRFPAGWRCGAEIENWNVPQVAKALARRAVGRLP